MPRSYEDIRKAKLKSELETTTQEVQQMPPGYQAGGRVGFKNSNFIVDPFIMNVRGRLVKLPTQQQVSGDEWTVTRRNGYYYYLYVSQDRSFSVRPSQPVFDETLFAYKHPTSGDRLLGVGFVDSQGEMVYASSHLSIDTHEVTVVASDYAGEDYDYRCDGVADDVEINHAIRYMAASKGKDGSGNDLPGGGIVRLSPGTFNLSSDIRMLGSITLEGSGYGTKIVPRSTNDDQRHGIYILGLPNNTIDGCVIRNLRVQRSEKNAAYGSLTDADATAPKEILAEHADNLIIENNWIVDAPYGGIEVSGSKDFLVSGNVIQDTHVVSGTSPSQSIFLGSGDDDHGLSGRVVNNQVYNTAVTAASLVGIVMRSPGKVLIANNVVRNFLCNSTDSVIGIYVRGSACTVSGNLLFDFRNSHDDTNGCWAIQVRDAPNCHVVGNTIRDIHGFPNTDTNQAGTGIYLTRESSVVPNDAHVASNLIESCDQGIFIEDAGTDIYRVMLSGNQVYDCGQLIFHGHCESDLSANAPILLADAAAAGPTTANMTSWARSSAQAYEGTYSYLATFDGTSGEAYVGAGDNETTNDLHGLIPGVEYTLEAYYYVPSGGITATDVELWISDYVGSWTDSKQALASTTNAWQSASVTRSIRDDAVGIRIRIVSADDGDHANTETVYVDNIRLYPTKNQNAHENLLKDEGTDTRI